jgi:uncharacterized caspase-like protein
MSTGIASTLIRWLAVASLAWLPPAHATPAPTTRPANPALPAVVATPDRHALLLANADYPGDARDLANPVNDARLLARTLERLGFKVTVVENADRATLRQAVSRFADGLPAHATALVYYAGHGVQVGGTNYLMPTDSRLRNEATVAVEAYPLKSLLERLAAARSAVNVVVLDACRNNPFQPPPGARMRNWGIDGLARAAAPRGTLIAYSTAPGEVAADGAGANSLFAEALARELARPSQPLEQAFKRAGAWVRQQTRDEQIPWIESSLSADLYLQPPAGLPTVAASRDVLARAPQGQARGALRGGTGDSLWYSQMTASQWAELEWTINQRVKGLTADELPGLERKARAGSVVAMTTLGLAHRQGIQRSTNERIGVTRSQANNTQAMRWLRMAADAGFPVAQAELAEMHFKGHGVDRDVARTRALLQAAAATGYPRAELDLAHLNIIQNPSPESASELGKVMGRLLQQSPLLAPPREGSPR